MNRQVRGISAENLRELLMHEQPNLFSRNRGYALVNTEPQEEFEAGHIPFSVSVPLTGIRDLGRFFGKNKKIILYSGGMSDVRAKQAAEILQQRGFRKLYILHGGVQAWEETGAPVERGYDGVPFGELVDRDAA